MRHRSLLLSLAAGIVIACTALPGQADTITFDPAPSSRSEGDQISTETFTISGVAITAHHAIFAQQGGSVFGYPGVSNDTSDADSSGGSNWFITDELGSGVAHVDPVTNIAIDFNQAVMNLSFLIADLEQWADGNELMTAVAYGVDFADISGSAVLETILIDGFGSNSGNGSAQMVNFTASGIKSLVIDVTNIKVGGSGYFAFGVDNLSATAVPTPSSLAALASLSVMGLVGVGLRRRRNRRVA